MLPLRYTFRWRLAGVLLLMAVFLSTLLPAIWFLTNPRINFLFGLDKLAHAGVFLFLTVWFSGQYARGAWWRIALGLLIFGVMIEVCQRLTASRSAEWFDLIADVIGIVIGLLIAWAGAGGWSLRVENWLLSRSRAQ